MVNLVDQFDQFYYFSQITNPIKREERIFQNWKRMQKLPEIIPALPGLVCLIGDDSCYFPATPNTSSPLPIQVQGQGQEEQEQEEQEVCSAPLPPSSSSTLESCIMRSSSFVLKKPKIPRQVREKDISRIAKAMGWNFLSSTTTAPTQVLIHTGPCYYAPLCKKFTIGSVRLSARSAVCYAFKEDMCMDKEIVHVFKTSPHSIKEGGGITDDGSECVNPHHLALREPGLHKYDCSRKAKYIEMRKEEDLDPEGARELTNISKSYARKCERENKRMKRNRKKHKET